MAFRGDILDLAAIAASDPRLAAIYAPAERRSAPPVAVPVPGQNAQMVVPAGEQMPVDPRINQGFADAAMQPRPDASFVNDIVATLSGETVGTHGASDGLLSRFLPEGVGDFVGNAALGAAGADPTATPLTTFAQAFAGAQGAKNVRLDRKRAEQAAAEDTAYERGRDAKKDALEERKLVIDERAAARLERKAMIDELATAANIQHTQAETAKIEREYARAGLSFDESIEVEQAVINWINSLTSEGGRMTTEERKAEAARKRQELLENRTNSDNYDDEGDEGGTTEVPMTSTGEVQGDGSYESPYSVANGEISEEAFETLPIGAHYLYRGKKYTKER